MKILQVVSRFDFGGAENYVRELSNELCKQGNEVYIYSKQGRQVNLLNPKIHFLKAWLKSNLVLFQALSIIQIIRKHRIDVIHAHQRLPIISTCIAGFFTKKPIIATVHGRVKYDLRSKISRKIPSHFIFVSSKVLTISRYYKQIAHKSIVIPNGIPKTSVKYIHIPYQIGYISRLDSKHANVIYQLIEIFPKLSSEFSGISLSIIGDGDEFERIERIALTTNSYLGYNAIQVHGYIDNLSTVESIPELILGVGRVAIESAIKGCSVISVNSKRMGTFLNSENYEFYKENNFVNVNGCPPTANLLYDEILTFLKNREQNRSQSIYLTNKLHNDFDIELITKRISNIYTEAINRNTNSI